MRSQFRNFTTSSHTINHTSIGKKTIPKEKKDIFISYSNVLIRSRISLLLNIVKLVMEFVRRGYKLDLSF